MTKQKKQRIFNGLTSLTSGYRQLLVTKDFALRPVLSRTERGYIGKCSTIQVEPGELDYLFKVSWDDVSEKDSITQWCNGEWTNIPVGEYNTLWKQLANKYPWTLDFLKRVPMGTHYIPWEGYTLAEKGKARAAKSFLKQWHISGFDIDDFVKSPKEHLNYIPVKAPEGLLDHIPILEKITTLGETSIHKNHWYMDIGHRIVKVQYDYSERPGKALKDIIPNDIKTLIHIEEGAYEHEGVFHGIKAAVYDLT